MFQSSAATAREAAPAVGQMAPAFTLPSRDGSLVSLEDFRGQWVVLYFYPKDNTPGCTIEARSFQLDMPQYKKLNAVVLGMSLDSEESHKAFCGMQGLTFRILSDKQKQVTMKYRSLRNVLGFKMVARNTFLIDREGRIAKVWRSVSPSSHSAEVLLELQKVASTAGQR
jgi:peroxiredoxin Q/BCP